MIYISNKNRAYSEVYAFIQAMGNEYKDKIPLEIYNKIVEYRDKTYNPIYNRNDNLKKEDISQEALALIAAFNLSYWYNEEEKKSLKEQLVKNQEKQDKEVNDIFNNKWTNDENNDNNIVENEAKNSNANQQLDLVDYKKSNPFSNILNKMKEILSNIFRKKK